MVGFKHGLPPALFHVFVFKSSRRRYVEGKRNVRVMSVPVEVSSLNEGDVFILDTGKVLYQWNGGGPVLVHSSVR